MPIPRALVPVLALVLAALPAAAVRAGDIGYVDMQKVVEQSAVGKKLQEELRKSFEPKAQALGKQEQEIRQLQETLKRDSALMSKEQLDKKQAELKSKIEAYQKEAGEAQQELLKAQQEKGPEVLVPARKAVDSIAKKRKLSMVVDRSQPGIVYLDDSLDLTDEVVKSMDAGAK
jgi:outer membrane protein